MLANVNLRAHPDKSIFGADKLEYLGHNISAAGLTPHEAKVAAIRQLRAPTNVSELRSLLGFINYYRCYVPDFSRKAQPLNKLLAKDVPWQWGPEQQAAVNALKDELCDNGKVLRQAKAGVPYVLHTDWSKEGISGVLGQVDKDGNEYMVACISRSTNKHERNYSSYNGELLAAVWSIKTFRCYLQDL